MGAAANRANRMDKRSLCYLIICFNIFVLCFWLVSVEPQPTAEESAAAAAAITTQTSANGSKPNQINDLSSPSRTLSTYYNRSLVSLDKAATVASTPTPTPSPASQPTIATATATNADTQLIDLHNFAYLMTQEPCATHIQALVLVHTAPRNAEKRALIRQTWGSQRMSSHGSPLRVIFLLGAVPQAQQQLQHALKHENARHKDMVQGNFQDAYRNMTYKHVMALKWFTQNCAQAQLLIKVDDDVFVNTPQLIKLLREPNSNQTTATSGTALRMLLQQRRDLMFCRPVSGSRVKRSYRSKWRVSFSEYAASYYPTYCPGFAIVYSADVVQRLYQAAQLSNYFWVDDVHITGVLAEKTNTSITDLQPFVLYEADCERLLSGERELEQQQFLFTWHSIGLEQISALWQLYISQNYTLTQRSVEPDSITDTGFS
ncbi:CG11357 [Drosophila busckii]|uniref:Hexosyltransferase n=1 Tax=Drosophila busckii TaxID=30019 RepID=A0A0M4EG73_DROBS|nr:beta-1,3-galactosyltransferase 1 [Drosophila busckii]XP_017843996.1 beta-1,3-galactosyltransferase 1 [Drosophila busckii]XP_017843997.1 beta-1,3-galactosyltransferase 1 [Drosophila busckii]XP_017843998.1 beta-1,3-galactosyltransferase 1 [Drosophila busckii]ALC43365.1 CG11357 [Drosophila busckii]